MFLEILQIFFELNPVKWLITYIMDGSNRRWVADADEESQEIWGLDKRRHGVQLGTAEIPPQSLDYILS